MLLTLLNQSLDIIDISTWTGDPHNGSFIAGQLRLLADTIDEARQVLKGGEEVDGGRWWEEPGDETVRSSPPLGVHRLLLYSRPTRTKHLFSVRVPSPPSAISFFHSSSSRKFITHFRIAIRSPCFPPSLRTHLHHRRRPCPIPTHPRPHQHRPFFLLSYLLVHCFFPDRLLAAPPSRPIAETAAA